MNKYSVFGIYMLICVVAHAQKVTVMAQSEVVANDRLEGYSTQLEGSKDEVTSAWIKFLKESGKVRQGDHITVLDPVIAGTTYPKAIVHSLLNDKGKTVYVWLGLNERDWNSADLGRVKEELEKVVYRFGVKFYKDRIQLRINEAQQASDAVDKQKQRLINQAKDLQISLANNAKEKLELDKSLETNKLELTALQVKIANNKKAQDSLANASTLIQKVKGSHVERQKNVE